MKQAVLKRKILECVGLGEKVMLRIQTKKWNWKWRGREKIRKCNRKRHVETVNEETKESISEEEYIGIRKSRRRSRFDSMNEDVKGWISSSKKQESLPEITKTKETIRLEHMKRKVKIAALEWDDFVLQEQLKYLM